MVKAVFMSEHGLSSFARMEAFRHIHLDTPMINMA